MIRTAKRRQPNLLTTTVYTALVTDANGCTTTASVTVNVAPLLTVTATADDYNIGTCPVSDAQLTAVANGGEPLYTYLWSPAAGLSNVNIANPVAKPASDYLLYGSYHGY